MVHWEPSSYDSSEGGTTVRTTTPYNTYNWPSHTWDNSWPTSTPTTVSKSFNTDNTKGGKIISWQNNSWTTRRTTTPSTVPIYRQTEAPVREITSKSVLATPSDPTAPLVETATFSSNPWPSQFSSDLLGKVGNTKTVKTPEQSGPQKKRDEILKKNYFFTPSPTPLHLRNGINKIPSFESEFTAFGSDAHKSTFSSFDTNFDTDRFVDDSKRLKKEIKSSDAADTYYHYGHHDSSAYASEGHQSGGPVKSNVLRDEHKKDIVQLYIPDPLAPGHPRGNGNHGWAPIEDWAGAQLRENLDTPAWADIPSANSILDWSDKTKPSTGTSVNSIKKWTSPAPATYHSPTPAALVRSTTVRPERVTVSQAEISTMRPPPSPVTPLYSTNFGNYASLDVQHVGGPTGAPGLALFNTVAPPPHQPHSNSHYMEQNPFIVSPVTPAAAAAIKRNIDPADFWSYNPVTEASSVKSYSPLPR